MRAIVNHMHLSFLPGAVSGTAFLQYGKHSLGVAIMKLKVWVSLPAFLVLLLLSACAALTKNGSTAIAPAQQLFTETSRARSVLLERSDNKYLKSLSMDPSSKKVTFVDVNLAIIDAASEHIAVTLPGGQSTLFSKRAFNELAPGVSGWVGYKPSVWKAEHPEATKEIDADPLYSISLVREGENLVGEVVDNGTHYRLESIGPAQFVLIEVDQSKLPPEKELLIDAQSAPTEDAPVIPTSARSFIRVLLVSTIEARAKNPNYKAAMAQALQDANVYMINSNVAITYEIAGYYDAEYSDEGKGSQLGDLKEPTRPLGAAVAPIRDQLRADLVTMYSTNPSYCGMGFVNAGRSTAFSVISCLSSMSHELGHNLGANHNWEEGQAEGNPKYQYGFRYTGTPRFRTQMSYDCSGGACPKIGYHSNPRLTYEGIAIGTVEHHDVARRFNERRETVENFYPPPVTPIHYTLYEKPFHKGKACRFERNSEDKIDIQQQCGSDWSDVGSAQVIYLKPGYRVRFGSDEGSISFVNGGDMTILRALIIGSSIAPIGFDVEFHGETGKIKWVTTTPK
jgi:hypothetical protein